MLRSLLDLTDNAGHDVQRPMLRPASPADALIVSIDTEFEPHRLQEKVVEVGMTVLDTRDIYNTEAGPFASNWFEKTRTYHYVMDKTRRPAQRVRGCLFGNGHLGSPDRVVAEIVDTLLRHYHGPPASHSTHNAAERKLIFIGHSLEQDVSILRSCRDTQLDITTRLTPEVPISAFFDTYLLAQKAKIAGAQIPEFSLSSLLNWLGVPLQYRRGAQVAGWHNAGNDAAYTMMAALIMAVNWEHIIKPGYGALSGFVQKRSVMYLDGKARKARGHKIVAAKAREQARAASPFEWLDAEARRQARDPNLFDRLDAAVSRFILGKNLWSKYE